MKTSPARPARRTVRQSEPADRPVILDDTSRPGRLQERFDEARLTRAFESLDAAMAELDALVRKKPDENRK